MSHSPWNTLDRVGVPLPLNEAGVRVSFSKRTEVFCIWKWLEWRSGDPAITVSCHVLVNYSKGPGKRRADVLARMTMPSLGVAPTSAALLPAWSQGARGALRWVGQVGAAARIPCLPLAVIWFAKSLYSLNFGFKYKMESYYKCTSEADCVKDLHGVPSLKCKLSYCKAKQYMW